MKYLYVLLISILCFGCVTTTQNSAYSLDDAIKLSADNIINTLGNKTAEPVGSKTVIAVLNFISQSEDLSSYVVEELSLALTAGYNITIVERQRLDIIKQEIDFQASGEVSEESAQSIGAKLGAEYVVIGSLTDMKDAYRFRIYALHVESAAKTAPTSVDIRYSEKKVKSLMGTVLSVPKRIKNSSKTDTSITLAWDAVIGATQYNIYRYDEINKKNMLIKTMSATYLNMLIKTVPTIYFEDTDLVPNTKYSYKVSAFVKNTESALSAAVSVTTNNIPIPKNVRSKRTDTSITLEWDRIPTATGYNIYRLGISDSNYEIIKIVSTTSFEDADLVPNTKYLYKVSALVKNVESVLSDSIIVTTDWAVPTGLRGSSITDWSMALEWNGTANATSYNIYRSGTIIANVSTTTFTDSNLIANSGYSYAVSALYGIAESKQSASVSVSTTKKSYGTVIVKATGKEDIYGVILHGADAGLVYNFYTIRGGNYNNQDIPSGTYYVSARLDGKKTYTSKSFTVASGHTVSVSVYKAGFWDRSSSDELAFEIKN